MRMKSWRRVGVHVCVGGAVFVTEITKYDDTLSYSQVLTSTTCIVCPHVTV